jgi:hypothetical protein
VISSFRKYVFAVTEFLILGTIFAVLTITEDEKEIAEVIEQLLVAIYTNPIFEFNEQERLGVARITYQIKSYIGMLNFYARRFTNYLPLLKSSLQEGLTQGLEICNVSADELHYAQNPKNFFMDRLLGRLKFYFYLCWPMFNITSNTILRWLNSRTGIEIWPVKNPRSNF